jgi:hypothetical protein
MTSIKGKEHLLNENYTYILELCSEWNQIIQVYGTPQLLIRYSAILQSEAAALNLSRPQRFAFHSISEVVDHLARMENSSQSSSDCPVAIEGYMLLDTKGMRLKPKSDIYKLLHKLRYWG